ncbi:MAG TPA: polyphosphate kinase 2, partial [Acidimicrobiia bacterium]|nr:polyphosphate kinase 2 [Acidimicrobiia bacterium]
MAHHDRDHHDKLPVRTYEKNMARVQRELVKLQEWVRQEGLKV